ncbi:MAG: hypothetical protein JWN72_233 [Thermoleophilia bacterium]|nr:hypothetical protein [Thermoleophilia bacterium]
MVATVGIKMFNEALVSIARNQLAEAGALVKTGYLGSWRELDRMHIHPARIAELKNIGNDLSAGNHQPGVEQALIGFIETLGG